MNLAFVFGGGMVCLVGLGATGLILLGEDKRKKAWEARREETVGPYLKPKTAGGPALVVAVRAKQRSTKKNPFYTLVNFKEEGAGAHRLVLAASFRHPAYAHVPGRLSR